jgi:uncharacterized protein YjeT (DUF2065 family)
MSTFMFAKFLGIYLLVIGLAILLDPKRFRNSYKKLVTSDSSMMVGGSMALLFGAFVVTFHNYWELGWPVIVTILGWWSVIKGAALFLVPDIGKKMAPLFKVNKKTENGFRLLGGIAALVGLFLSYQGWM